EEASLLLVEGAERCSRLLHRKRVPHREAERVLLHRVTRLVGWVRGRRDHAAALFLQLWPRRFDRSQLLLAVRSPVSAVDQEHAPAIRDGLGKRERPVAGGPNGQRRDRLAAVENPRPGSSQQELLSRTPPVAAWAGVSLSIKHPPRPGIPVGRPPR